MNSRSITHLYRARETTFQEMCARPSYCPHCCNIRKQLETCQTLLCVRLHFPHRNTAHGSMFLQITELAGYTARVAEMFEVFEDMKTGQYVRNVVATQKPGKQQLHKIQGPLEMNGAHLLCRSLFCGFSPEYPLSRNCFMEFAVEGRYSKLKNCLHVFCLGQHVGCHGL